MCYYCGTYSYYNYYQPLQYSAPMCCYPTYPTCGSSSPYYGYGASGYGGMGYGASGYGGMGYGASGYGGYGYGAMPYMSRGEHRVGNCLCICQ